MSIQGSELAILTARFGAAHFGAARFGYTPRKTIAVPPTTGKFFIRYRRRYSVVVSYTAVRR